MTRQTVKVSDNIIGRYDTYTLDELVHILNTNVNRVPEELRHTVKFEIEMYSEQYDPNEYPYMFMHYERPETDAEYNFRLKNEENSAHLQAIRDKAEYERLRKQFEAK